MKRGQTTTRKIPPSIAGLLQELELRQPKVVIGSQLADLIRAAGSSLTNAAAADRLVRGGWFHPLRTRGAWEFVPASRAGRYASGDPWIELRALLAHNPNAPAAVAFASAVWELGFSSHPPADPTFAFRPGWRPPRSVNDAKSVRYDWRLAAHPKNGLPLWQSATIVVAAAHRPSAQSNWANADEWLPETLHTTTPEEIVIEADGRGAATVARLGHLAEWAGRGDIAEALRPLLPERLSVSYLGPRSPRGRWIKRWRLYDSLLPDR